MIPLLASLLSCSAPSVLDQPTAGQASRPARYQPTAMPLARRVFAAESLELPESSRPGGQRAPAAVGLLEPFASVGRYSGVDVYKTPLPLSADLLPDKLKGTHSFGSAAPDGLEVRGPNGALPFERAGRRANSYGFDREWLYVGVPAGGQAPAWEEIFVIFPRATEHEDGLNRSGFDGTDEDFVARGFTVDEVSTTGLYLPAPGVASWRFTLPEAAVFTTRVRIVPPGLRSATRSDGATLIAELLDGETVLDSVEVSASVGAWTALRWDLSAHAGEDRTLRLRSEPGGNPHYDYVFLEEPTVYTPSASPRRTVMIFVDTLRPDHVGLYGYHRATTPFIDRWGAHAAVFEQARSVAPWTLPSARAVLTGHQPEAWFDVDTLPERFGDAGYATEAIVANAFLSQPFDVHRGWSRFEYEHLMPADQVTAAALEAIARHPDRDLLLMVHYMDPHLPYEEGLAYRYRWVIRSPDGVAPARARLYDATYTADEQAAMKHYVEGRYDQNIRFVDDSVRAVLEAAGPDATTVFFSDHGEEFWDHGSFEHGHSFYDELLEVPLVIRSPWAPPGRYAEPVSLLDVTPTLLDLAGLEPTDGPGRSLVDRMYGVEGEAEALLARPQAFGRPLYEQDGWAVLDGGHKWIDRGGVQVVHDLSGDPGETTDVAGAAELGRYPVALSDALDREVLEVWRVRARTRKAHGRIDLQLAHPEGFREAWMSYDPRGRSAGVLIEVIDGRVRVQKPPGVEMPEAIFLVPNGDFARPAGLELEATTTGQPRLAASASLELVGPGPERQVILQAGDKGWAFTVDTARVPVRSGVEVSGFHADVAGQLKDLGYLDE